MQLSTSDLSQVGCSAQRLLQQAKVFHDPYTIGLSDRELGTVWRHAFPRTLHVQMTMKICLNYDRIEDPLLLLH